MPAPSMKNGRFSEKYTGKRWLTSTWKASLSTWLKSGFTVASSVIVDVRPHLALMPRSPVVVDVPQSRRRLAVLRRGSRWPTGSPRASAAPADP